MVSDINSDETNAFVISRAAANPTGVCFEQRLLFAAGTVLVVSGLVHLAIWLYDDSSLAGPVSWRKPILFGFSAGATLVSLGWLVSKLRHYRSDAFLLPMFAAAMLLEAKTYTLGRITHRWRTQSPDDPTADGQIHPTFFSCTMVIFAGSRPPDETPSDLHRGFVD